MLVPNSCKELAIEATNRAINFALAERQRKLAALDNLEQFDKTQLIEVLTGKGPAYYRSQIYNEVYFHFLAAEVFADREMVGSIRESLINAAKTLVNKQFSYVESLQIFKESLESSGDEVERSGRLLFQVIVSNSGHDDGLVYPSAKLRVGNTVINLTQTTITSLNNSNPNLGDRYGLAPKGSVAILYFLASPAHNNAEANRLAGSIARADSPISFELSIETDVGEVSTSSVLNVETISFEIEFPTLRPTD